MKQNHSTITITELKDCFYILFNNNFILGTYHFNKILNKFDLKHLNKPIKIDLHNINIINKNIFNQITNLKSKYKNLDIELLNLKKDCIK